MKLSAVVLTKNEERNIERCLKSLLFCDEIIIIDDYSSDKTIEVIKNLKLKVKNYNLKLKIFKRLLNGDFSGQRNFGMEKTRGDWVLFLDADEEVSKDLKEEIKKIIDIHHSLFKEDVVAFYIKRRDWWWGRELKYGEVKKIRNKGLIRLLKKNSGKWVGKVHEKFKVQSSKLKVKVLKNYINHYPHQTLKEFISEINFYSTLKANELKTLGKKTNIFEIIFYPLGKFILNYLLYFGFLDGPSGFAYTFLMSFHSFLVRAKLYKLQIIGHYGE